MAIYEFEGRIPKIEKGSYVAPSAQVIGKVIIGRDCYIGHGAILRGDYGTIEIGDGTAIEEGVIIHARPGDMTKIGKRGTIGHGAMIHNAVIHDEAVIGMRAVISDFSEVGRGSIIGEMGLVKQGQKIPEKKIAVGLPVRIIGDVGDQHADMALWAKELYIDLAHRYPEGLKEITERVDLWSVPDRNS